MRTGATPRALKRSVGGGPHKSRSCAADRDLPSGFQAAWIGQPYVELHLRNLRRAPRCGAKTRAGSPCESPAIHGRRGAVCMGVAVPALRVAAKTEISRPETRLPTPSKSADGCDLSFSVCQQRHSGMTHSSNNSPARVACQHRLPPVRVKVFRADGKLAKVHPPDGEAKHWWRRLNEALGTTSSDFVNASLFQYRLLLVRLWAEFQNSP